MFELLIDTELIVKLLLAVLFGGIIGLLRENEKKAAGLRTHILVCLGSALFSLISIFAAEKFPGESAGRIAASVVTGIGFIGAGTIIQAGSSVMGITTAASIWTTAAIGMALAFGFYDGAAIVTLFTIIALTLLGRFEKKYIHARDEK